MELENIPTPKKDELGRQFDKVQSTIIEEKESNEQSQTTAQFLIASTLIDLVGLMEQFVVVANGINQHCSEIEMNLRYNNRSK